MQINHATLRTLIEAVATRVIDHEDALSALDQAIGDGDHGANMKRGFDAVLAKIDESTAKPVGEAVSDIGMTLVMVIGGASGPLYGTLFLALGKAIGVGDPFLQAFETAVQAVMKRGRSEAGEKTMLDTLVPVLSHIKRNGWQDLARVRTVAFHAAEATKPMLATKGRASFLGERSIGHVDPGARSCALMVAAVCDVLEAAE